MPPKGNFRRKEETPIEAVRKLRPACREPAKREGQLETPAKKTVHGAVIE